MMMMMGQLQLSTERKRKRIHHSAERSRRKSIRFVKKILVLIVHVVPLVFALLILYQHHSLVNMSESTTPMDPNTRPPIIQERNKTRKQAEYTPETEAEASKSSCLSLNSKEWIQGPRRGNINATYLNNDFLRQNIVDFPDILSEPGKARSVLSMSLAFNSSRFVDDSETGTDAYSIRLWQSRLFYLAFHWHQHKFALEETKLRLNTDTCENELGQHNIGNFDFQCKDAKFLLVGLSSNGLGVNVRSGIAVAMMLAMVTDRVLILVSGAPQGPRHLKFKWKLSSCDRHDHQCFFTPLSPCVPTQEEIDQSPTFKDYRNILRFGNLDRMDTEIRDLRVINFRLRFTPPQIVPKVVKERLQDISRELAQSLPAADPRRKAIMQAIDSMLEKEAKREGYNYALANLHSAHALAVYALRPQAPNLEQIDKLVEASLPRGEAASHAIGIPVRASDKCDKESECLTFYDHMKVASLEWRDYRKKLSQHPSIPVPVIFTTESSAMVKELEAFQSNTTFQQKLPYNYSFYTNEADVTPDTGFFSERSYSFTADENMMSALVSLKLQMAARRTIANCCSNFHTLLGDFLAEGLGRLEENHFHCLQEEDRDPRLRVCCGWHADCIREKKMLENNEAM